MEKWNKNLACFFFLPICPTTTNIYHCVTKVSILGNIKSMSCDQSCDKCKCMSFESNMYVMWLV